MMMRCVIMCVSGLCLIGCSAAVTDVSIGSNISTDHVVLIVGSVE